LNLNRGTVGVGRALKCVYGLCLVSQALGRGHRTFDAARPRSGVPCAPPPCGAAAAWPNPPVPPHCGMCRCPLTLPPSRLHPVACLVCRPGWVVPLEPSEGSARVDLSIFFHVCLSGCCHRPARPSQSPLVLARWLGAWPLPRCRDVSARAFTCDATRPAYRVLAALYSGSPPHSVSVAPSPVGSAWHTRLLPV
jgi:hypothetical protein